MLFKFFLLANKYITKIYKIYLYTIYGKVVFDNSVNLLGLPILQVSKRSTFHFGRNVSIISNTRFNMAGLNKKTTIYTADKSSLVVSDNVGISGVSIYCSKSIFIGENVLIGVNVYIWDTDFHSVNSTERLSIGKDIPNTAPIRIEKNVFVGANSIILKGVTIGEGSVIAAGSVVSKNVPPMQIWGGNPIQFIKMAN